ncbi:MAG: HAD family phosphatase, partial [Lachnospiraceae bacterium]|nr:HAD family phosphatase [Lachnospiraceae bacterium]
DKRFLYDGKEVSASFFFFANYNFTLCRMIFSDIDGTLLPFSGKDLGPTHLLLSRLIQAGYHFVPCTGRGTGNIPREILTIPGLRYVITGNGAIVTDLQEGRASYQRRVPREAARRLTAFLRRYQGKVFSYRQGEHYIDCRKGEVLPASDSPTLSDWMNSVIVMDFDDYLAQPESDFLDKMGFATFDPAARAAVLQDVKQEDFYPEFSVSTSGYWNVEFNAAGANKGDAALWLAEKLGFGAEQMLAAGDNFNDIPLLECAYLSLAPANAEEEIRRLADVVVEDCRLDGVEKYLRQLLPD